MSLEQSKKDQPTAAPAQTNQGAPAPARFVTKPISDPRYVQSPKAESRKLNLPVSADETEKDLFLVVLDKDLVNAGKKEKHDNSYQIYLGRSKTFKRGEGPDQYNMLVPIIPRCHATANRDPAQAVEVPEGWLYIIRQFTNPLTGDSKPELWRELYSDGLGNFSDVNLNRFEGKDQRKATCQSGIRIIVPYRINKKDHQLWIAYSEVQWSWNRVQSMKQDSKLRDQRMHKLDLSDCLNDFAGSNFTSVVDSLKSFVEKLGPLGDIANPLMDTVKPYVDKMAFRLKQAVPDGQPATETTKSGQKNALQNNTALLYNLNSAPDPQSRNLPASFKEAIPVVYLDNPIGIGRKLAGKYKQHWQDLTDCVNGLRAMPDLVTIPGLYAPGSAKNAEDQAKRRSPERWFEAAALANRYFYSKVSKVIPPGVKDIPAYEKRLTEIEDQFNQYQNKLDKPAIELALRVPQRTEIRKKLVRARENLVDFLEKELTALTPDKSGGAAQDPPLVHALDDYFTLTPLGDRDRKQNPNDVIGDKSTPRWRDNYLDGWGAVYDLVEFLGKHEYSIDADLEANPPDGWDWRRNNPAFKLLLDLADPEGGCPLHSRLFPKSAASDPLKIDATKVEDTATSFKKQHLDNLKDLKLRDADIAKSINLFGTNFSDVMAMRGEKDPAYEKQLQRAYHSLLRLVQTAANLTLQEEEVSLAELIAEAEKEPQLKKGGGAPIFKIFEKSADFLKKSVKDATDFPTTVKAQDGPLGRIRVRVVTVVNHSQTVSLLRDMGDQKAVTSGLAGFIGLVKIYNFSKALKAFTSNQNEDRDWEVFAPLVSTFLKLPDAIKGVWDLTDTMAAKKAAGGATKAAEGALEGWGTTRATEEATGYKMLGKFAKKATLVAYMFDFQMTLSSLVENLAQNDDAAIADVIGLSGITVGILAGFVSIPGAGWFFGLTALAALLAKAFLFKEDTPVEIWINNGPFSRGEEYHDQFSYHRSNTITKIKDANGNWVNTACTVHEYGSFQFLIDGKGTLVHAGVAPPPPASIAGSGLYIPGTMENQSPCKVAPNGNVYLKADPEKSIPADTHVATIGQPFEMHQLLKPRVKKEPASTKNAKNNAIIWHSPHDAYLALADAVYRPRVTLTEIYSNADTQCALKLKLPFYLPGKSLLFIEFGEKDQKLRTFDPGSIDNLKVGSGEYEIVEQFPYWETKSFTAKVRLELLGKGDVQLPHESLFCGADIETQIDEHTTKGIQSRTETKWIVAEKKVSGKIKTHSKLEGYVDVLIDNIKSIF
jgi:hypothetical protein